jgi:hypothetical protein
MPDAEQRKREQKIEAADATALAHPEVGNQVAREDARGGYE